MPNKPYLCIFHGNCTDGFGAAFSVYSSPIGPETEFVKGIFGELPPDVANRHVLIVDFSYSLDLMRKIAEQSLSVTILDHHASAQIELQPLLDQGLIHGYFDMSKSGAMMAWEYFHPNSPAPDLIKYIQDRDLELYELPDSKEIHAGISSYPLDFTFWKDLIKKDIYDFYPDGEILLRKKQRDIEQLLPLVSRILKIAGHHVPAANVPYYLATDVGNLLAIDAPFAVTYYDTQTERVFSLRSTDVGLNVSLIAEFYNGGGHPKSAGFRVPLKSIMTLEPNYCSTCFDLHVDSDSCLFMKHQALV